MENNPKKSKALIITIIIIIIIILIGFLVYRNRDSFGAKTSETISKIFSPLVPSVNSKNLKTVDENSVKVVAQAGEDIKAGDNLSLSGTDENNNPIVVKAGKGGNIYGFAGQDFSYGELGEVIINGGNPNGFFNSFSDFLNNLFEGNNQNDMPFGGWSFDNDLGIWVFDPNGNGGWIFDPNGNGWVPPGGGSGSYNPQCSDMLDNDTDGGIDINDPNCHLGGALSGEYLPNHYSESSNPLGGGGFDFTPQCSDTKDNDSDEAIDVNDPNCHLGGALSGEYLPNHYSESSNPWGGVLTYECNDEVDNDSDTLIDTLDPACHAGGVIEGEYLPNHDNEVDSPCENGASNPPLCTIFEKEKIPDLTAGAISPTSALSGAQTTIYTSILNSGTGGSITSFPTLFTITNKNMTDLEINGDDNVVSQSKFKKIISKIFNSATWASIVKAATTGDVGVIINVNLSVTTPQINAGETKTISTTYNFATPGRYYIRACADKSSLNDRGVIVETNEDNNCGPWTIFNSSISLPPPGELPKCSDTIDNDRDSLIDDLDPACHLNGNLDEIYIPSHDSESIAPGMTYECSDGLDNDSDGLIDRLDPICHKEGEINGEYLPEYTSEEIIFSENNDQEENLCRYIEQNPLTFTSEEKARLAILLRKFYLISSSLRTVDDISTIYNEIDQQKNFMEEVDGLTKQCYLQSNDHDDFIKFCVRNKGLCDTTPETEFNNEANFAYSSLRPSFKGRGNPWFTQFIGGNFPYADKSGQEAAYFDVNWLEGNYKYDENGNYVSLRSRDDDDPTNDNDNTGPGCKVISGYYYGKTTKDFTQGYNPPISHYAGTDCDTFNTFDRYKSCTDVAGNRYGIDDNDPNSLPRPTIINAGCQWKEGFDWEQTERILKIW